MTYIYQKDDYGWNNLVAQCRGSLAPDIVDLLEGCGYTVVYR